MAGIQAGVRLLLQYNEAMNRHDVDGMLALLTEDCAFTSHTPAPEGATVSGKGAIGEYWRAFFAASPEARFEAEEVFGVGIPVRCAGSAVPWQAMRRLSSAYPTAPLSPVRRRRPATGPEPPGDR